MKPEYLNNIDDAKVEAASETILKLVMENLTPVERIIALTGTLAVVAFESKVSRANAEAFVQMALDTIDDAIRKGLATKGSVQ